MDTLIRTSVAEQEILRRNEIFDAYFDAHAPRLARACYDMSRRFLDGGRLLAFGRGAATTDAQHVSVEFVHPVIVGKRALPAMDLGQDFALSLPVLAKPSDMIMEFAFSELDSAELTKSIGRANSNGALTLALFGPSADYAFPLPDRDPFVCQEVAEVLYHVLWETVHVYFEHREQGHDVGASAFLYPFLGKQEQPMEGVIEEVQHSMRQKVAQVADLRTAASATEADKIERIAKLIADRIRRSGKLIAFGNGGSATDANDLVADCVMPPPGWRPIPGVSLSSEPANVTAVANDIGVEAIFARQLIAHAAPMDVAVGISTSGNSSNIIAALIEARKQGLLTIAIVGYDGGKIVHDHLSDYALTVRCDYIPRIQEVQASLYHILRARINASLKGGQ